MLNLNDDCLLNIITILRQSDQLNLKRVCTRLEGLVNDFWHLEYKNWSRNDYNSDAGALSWMVCHLHDHVEVLNLGKLDKDVINILGSTVFPNTHTLVANGCRSVPSKALDVFHQNFPKVQTLLFVGTISLNVLVKMKFLTELKLDFLFSGSDFRLRPIFTNLKLRKLSFCHIRDKLEICYDSNDVQSITQCQTLEELSINVELLNIMADKLPELRNLKMICCLGRYNENINVYHKVVKLYGERIHTLTSKFWSLHFPMNTLPKMPNLKKWSMLDLYVNRFDKNAVAPILSNIEELELINDKTIKPISYNGSVKIDEAFLDFNVLEFIAACKNLKVLTIPKEWLRVEVKLPELSSLLRSQRGRKSILKLRCLTHIPNAAHNIQQPDELYKDQLSISMVAYPEGEYDRFIVPPSNFIDSHEQLFEIHF